MIYISIGICILILVFSFLVYKDVASPVFVSGVVWLTSYLILLSSGSQLINSNYIDCFMIAYAFFSFGFFIINPRRTKAILNAENDVQINPLISTPILWIEYLASILWLSIYWRELLVRTSSVWHTIRSSDTDINYLSGVLINFFPIISAVSLYVFLKSNTRRNRNYFFLTLPPLIIAMLLASRMTWFYVIGMFIYVLIYTKKLSNKKIIKWALIGASIVVALFIISSLSKYSNIMRTSTSLEKIYYFFRVYFSSPSLAFLQWLENNQGFIYGYGKYTFRFFAALAKIVFPDLQVPSTIMVYTKVDGLRTNVYTALHWYTMDFGIIWAYLFQFLLGLLFGKIYKIVKKYENPDRFIMLVMSMLISVILGQFFCDTLMTHFSAWIQRIVFCYLACKYLVVETKVKETIPRRKKIRITFGNR